MHKAKLMPEKRATPSALPDQGPERMVDGKEVDLACIIFLIIITRSKLVDRMGKCGTNSHTMRIGIPFVLAIGLPEIKILRKWVK